MSKTKPTKNKSDVFWANMTDYICYWRLNVHRFIMEYMGVSLADFQQVVLYHMDSPTLETITSFIFFASRGLGKTWLTMTFSIAKCILWPGIKIKVVSSTIRQAIIFLNKVYEIKDGRPNVEREISGIHITKDGGIIDFFNTSSIEAVVCSDNSRGLRANIVIIDESRLTNENIINSVILNFLTLNNRGQPWCNDPKYADYMKTEHNSKIYLTSIGYKDEWSYKDFQKYVKFIQQGRNDYFAFSLPYQFGIEAGIIDRSYIESQVRENTADLKTLRMELEVIPHGESESAMFSFDDLNRARQLRVPLIPPTNDEYIEYKGILKNIPSYQKKEYKEIRVISMDIAIGGGRKNDLTVFTIFRLFENIEYYDKEVAYIEVMNGVNLDQQIVRLKQLFYDTECDYAVIDAGGAIGLEAINSAGNITKDVVRNRRYPGWRTMNKVEKFDMRTTDPNAEPVIFPIQVSGMSASAMQYNMLVIAQLEFQRKRISLLVDEELAVDELNRRYGYMRLKTSTNGIEVERANNMISSFYNTTELIDEAIKTQIVKLPSGRWVYDEKSGRKDRVISMIYGLYFINMLEQDLTALNQSIDVSEYISSVNYRKKNSNVRNPFANNFSKLAGFGSRR